MAVQLLKDLIWRWQTLQSLKVASAFASGGNAALGRATDVPDIDLYAVDVSFEANPDPKERDFLNMTPTSFELSDEQVDRLRAGAGAALCESSEFKRLLHDRAATPPPRPASTVVIR